VMLVYLAIQIRQNTAQVRQNSRILGLNAYQLVSASSSKILVDVAKHPELFRIWRMSWNSPADLVGDDLERFGMILHQFFASFESADLFAELDPSVRHRMRPTEDRFLQSPAVRAWWSREREIFADPFRSRIDARVREITASSKGRLNSTPAA